MARGYAPVAVVLLLAVTVLAAGGLAVALPSLPSEPPANRGLAVDATSDGRIEATLLSGDPIDVRNTTIRVAVDGDPLDHQPPVPYFAARGFRGTPTGPFNVAADPTWTVGETTTLHVAGTNDPVPSAGATVTVRVLVDGRVVAATDATVDQPDAQHRASKPVDALERVSPSPPARVS